MKIDYINNSITSYFDTIADNANLSVRYQNDPRPTPTDEIWCAASIDFGKTQQRTIGINSYKYIGNFNARIKERAGLGLSNLLVIADVISTAFKVVNIDNVKFRVPRIVNVGRVGDDHQINIICPFFADSSLSEVINFYGSIIGILSMGGGFTNVYLNILKTFDGISLTLSSLSGSLDSQPGLGSSITEISGIAASLGSIEIATKLRGSISEILNVGGELTNVYLNILKTFEGTSSTSSNLISTLDSQPGLESHITGTLNIGGELTNVYLNVIKTFEETLSILSNLSGSLDSQPGLGSSITEVSGAAALLGNIEIETKLIGSINGVSDILAQFDSQPGLIGRSIDGISSVDGSLRRAIRRIAGSIDGISDALGYLSGELILAGTINSVSDISGNLTDVTVEFTGSITETSGVSGWLDRFKLLGTINAISNVCLREGSITYESPLSVGDSTNRWDNEAYTIDENQGTSAQHACYQYIFTAPLGFTVSECNCIKIRVSGKTDRKCEVRGHYYDGSWHTVGYISLTGSQAWHEISFGSIRTITQFKLDFNCANIGEYTYIYEVEYNDTVIAGDLNVLTGLSGSITGTFDTSGSLDVIYMEGSITGISNNFGSLDRQQKLAGSTNGISSNSGALNFVTLNLSGSVSAESTIIGGDILGYTSRCSVYRNGAQAIVTGTWTQIILDTEDYDIDSEFDSVTNYRFQPDVTGYYHVDVGCWLDNLADGKTLQVSILKNEDKYVIARDTVGVASSHSLTTSRDIYLLDTDYIELWIWHDHGSDRNTGSGLRRAFMNVHRFA